MSFPLSSKPDSNTVVFVHGDRESGGDYTTYKVCEKTLDAQSEELGLIVFQSGPVKEVGVNGVTEENLIDICIHRLTCFQTGPYACEENNQVLVFLHAAKASLGKRTENRRMRGVEGTSAI